MVTAQWYWNSLPLATGNQPVRRPNLRSLSTWSWSASGPRLRAHVILFTRYWGGPGETNSDSASSQNVLLSSSKYSCYSSVSEPAALVLGNSESLATHCLGPCSHFPNTKLENTAGLKFGPRSCHRHGFIFIFSVLSDVDLKCINVSWTWSCSGIWTWWRG